jgi:DNA-binding transcriptional MerR regulator
MLTIGKIAAVLGVHPDTIRNYEKRGIIPRARRSAINGYRIWEPEDLHRIKQIFLDLTHGTGDGRQ